MPRAWLGATTFFCNCTYLELKRIESWRGSSCHCGRNELHRVVITCWRKSTGWWVEVEVEGGHTISTGWDNERLRQVPTQFLWACLHPASAPSPNICSHKRVSWLQTRGIYSRMSFNFNPSCSFLNFSSLSLALSVSQLCDYNAFCSVASEYLVFFCCHLYKDHVYSSSWHDFRHVPLLFSMSRCVFVSITSGMVGKTFSHKGECKAEH